MDLLQEQMKMLAGEVALSISSLKRLSEKAASNPGDSQLREQMRKLKDVINENRHQIRVLEQRMIGSVEKTPNTLNTAEMSQALSKLTTQLNEKTFELEIKSADNRVLQEQLQMKTSENAEMQETILLLRQQLNYKSSRNPQESADSETIIKTCSAELLEHNDGKNGIDSCEETHGDDNTPTSVMSLNRVFSREDAKECDKCTSLSSQVLFQASEMESLKQENVKLTEEKDGLEIQSNKLTEEASYAKELAAAAAVELRNLAEEVTRLSYENAKLNGELAAAKEAHCRSNCCERTTTHDFRQNKRSDRLELGHRKQGDRILIEELQKELNMRNQREAALEAALSEKEQIESDLRRRINEANRHEEDLENELTNMWMLIAKMRKHGVNVEDISSNDAQTGARNGSFPSNGHSFQSFKEEETFENLHGMETYEELRACYQEERRRCEELERLVSRMKGEDISTLDVTSLEELQNFHVEAITKICHAKCANYML
ncbi:aspartic proteinase Asp1-like isoform X1 [Hibiscus syriacus]|uniref:Aspartic proteinase Asp1-like isoform X1 n=1 Tax=Hibiscus syriacus TaxID=106335 RepID=A0A6A2ZFT5_HIBSY|nr:aspartic proteinase Asp1-like isoform X1 [Hibiscus syriacus]